MAFSFPPLLRDRSLLEWILVAALLLLLGAASIHLFPFWQESPELSHAFFAPALSLWLLHLSRRQPDLASPPSSYRPAMLALLAATTLFFGFITTLAALAQGAAHSQPTFLGAITLWLVLVGGTYALAQNSRPLVRFNGASLCAATLWLFATPLPSGVLSRLSFFLQDKVTEFSLQTLRLLGIPAMRHGNVLELASQFVGVEEACSGIRSLIACLFAGAFLGGLLLRGVWPRLIAIVASGFIAVAANFLRSLFLCLLAAKGVDISGFWHDITAYAVLGLTVVILYGGCSLAESDQPGPPPSDPPPSRHRSPSFLWWPLGTTVCLLLFASLVWFRTLPAADGDRPTPDVTALLNLDTPGWTRHPNDEIFQFARALNTDHLYETAYRRGSTQVIFYVAYWPSRQSTLGNVSLHTPELCLPGGGWEPLPLPPPEPSYPLPHPQRYAFEKSSQLQHVWFWHFFGGELVRDLPGLYPWQLGPYLLRRPVRSNAPQWVIRVSSNQPLESLNEDPLLKDFFTRLYDAQLTPAPLL